MTWPFVAALALVILALGGGALLLRKIAWPPMATEDGRKFWAFFGILGGCFLFTLFAAVGVWLVSNNAKYSFYLALAAHLQLFVGMSTFGFILGRRMKGKAGKGGIEWDDSSVPANQPITTTTTTTVGLPVTGEPS